VLSDLLSTPKAVVYLKNLLGLEVPADRLTYAYRTGNLKAAKVGGRWYTWAEALEDYVKHNQGEP
jgi:hypothetical protein